MKTNYCIFLNWRKAKQRQWETDEAARRGVAMAYGVFVTADVCLLSTSHLPVQSQAMLCTLSLFIFDVATRTQGVISFYLKGHIEVIFLQSEGFQP